MPLHWTVEVDGLPVAQGSVQAFARGGRAFIVQGGDAKRRERLGTWRQGIAARAREAGLVPIDGPVGVTLMFVLPRPKSRKKREVWPDRRPDIDKLTRSALDALTGIAWLDDGQIVRCFAHKVYATPTRTPGLKVTIEPIAVSDIGGA